jgi:hypothetical protein
MFSSDTQNYWHKANAKLTEKSTFLHPEMHSKWEGTEPIHGKQLRKLKMQLEGQLEEVSTWFRFCWFLGYLTVLYQL